MKNSVILMLFVFLTLGGNLNAQQGKHSKMDKGEMLEKMKERLSLSDQQVTQIKAIDAKYKSQEQDLKSQMQKVKEEHKAVRTQKKNEIDQVLTAEQRNKIKEWKNTSKKGKKSFKKDGRIDKQGKINRKMELKTQ